MVVVTHIRKIAAIMDEINGTVAPGAITIAIVVMVSGVNTTTMKIVVEAATETTPLKDGETQEKGLEEDDGIGFKKLTYVF